MLYDMLEFIFVVTVFMAALAAVIAPPAIGITYLECNAKAEALGLPHTWGVFQGCFVVVGDQPLPLNVYLDRVVEQNLAVKVKP